MIQAVKIKDKELKLPIIQGGMGVGISLSSLAGAVMKEDGMGVISAAHPGYQEPNFFQDSLQCNIKAIHKHVQKAREIAQGHGLCAMNIMVASKDYDTYVKASVDAKVDAIISGAGIPLHLPSLVPDSIAIAPIVSSGKTAKLICRGWDQRYQRIPDFIVIEGKEAGGHLGFSLDDLMQAKAPTLLEILQEVKEVVQPYSEKYQKEVPIFVAGGIYTGKDIAYYIQHGASGVQMATRFIATYECDAHEDLKQALIAAKKEDIVFVKSPTGLPGRAILNTFAKTLLTQRIPPTKCVQCIKPCIPKTTPYCISEALIHAVQGNVEQGLLFCGSNAYRLDRLYHVKELIEELKQEWEEEL